MKIRIRSENTKDALLQAHDLIVENVETGEKINDMSKLTLHLDGLSPVSSTLERIEVKTDCVKKVEYMVLPHNIDLILDFDEDKNQFVIKRTEELRENKDANKRI